MSRRETPSVPGNGLGMHNVASGRWLMTILKKRLWLLILVAITILFVVVSVWVTLIMTEERPVYAQYNTLYVPAEAPTVVGFSKPQRGELVVELSTLSSQEWEITPDEGDTYTVTGDYPTIRLLDRLHTYRILPRNSDSTTFPIILQVDYCSSEVYTAAGRTSPDNYHVVHSNLPVGRFKRYPIDHFTAYTFDSQEIDAAQSILSDEAGMDLTQGTSAKIEQLVTFLLHNLSDRLGVPTDEMNTLSPLQEYYHALDGKSPVWCSNLADIYLFFATIAGIPTRLVDVGGELDGVVLSGHGFAESYISEKGQWAYVDLTSNTAYVTDSQGSFMNTLDLFYRIRAGSYEGLTAAVFKDDEITSVPYADANETNVYYFSSDATFKFRLLDANFEPTELVLYSLAPVDEEHIDNTIVRILNWHTVILALIWGSVVLVWLAKRFKVVPRLFGRVKQ